MTQHLQGIGAVDDCRLVQLPRQREEELPRATLDNLTLATPALNRYEKRGLDAAEWLPELNRCWYARTIISVRQEHRLTFDRQGAAAPEAVLAKCGSG